MKNWLLVCGLLIGVPSVAQTRFYYENDKYFELGGSIGLMNCRTDLSRKINWDNAQTAGSVFAAFNYQNVWVARAEFTFGSVSASDHNSKDDKLIPRGLNFHSNLTEVALIGEFHPLNMNYFTDMYGAPELSPYIAAGVGMFWFNPKGSYDGQTYELSKYHLEGQGFPETGRKPYSLQQYSFPLGIGLKYDVSPRLTLRGEFLYRFTTTDYLDDVSSTYIDPKLFDKYLLPADAAIAKNIYKRIKDVPGRTTTTGERRGLDDKDGYFTIGLKLSVSLSRRYDYW